MSIHDETWDKSLRIQREQEDAWIEALQQENHTAALIVKYGHKANSLEEMRQLAHKDAVEAVREKVRQTPIDVPQVKAVCLADIPLDNFLTLSNAIENAGGNSYNVLKEHRAFLNILSSNNISITATYHGKRKS